MGHTMRERLVERLVAAFSAEPFPLPDEEWVPAIREALVKADLADIVVSRRSLSDVPLSGVEGGVSEAEALRELRMKNWPARTRFVVLSDDKVYASDGDLPAPGTRMAVDVDGYVRAREDGGSGRVVGSFVRELAEP